MQINEAYKILEVSSDISDNDLKTKYKQLAKQYHPDRFKEDPDRFKKINEAHQLITDYRANPEKYQQRSPFGRNPFSQSDMGGFSIEDIFQGFTNKRDKKPRQHHQPINIDVDLSFKESITGCQRDLKYNKHIKCIDCDGRGKNYKPNDCKECNGFGQSVKNNGNMVFTQSCGYCRGKGVDNSPCKKCNEKGQTSTETNIKISIPSGVLNGSALRLQGAGHFMGANMFGDAHNDVIVSIKVEKDNELELIDNDVVYKLQLSLIDALTGISKEIKTINGNQSIDVPPMSKNKDEIILNGLGVKEHGGNQRIILNIDYPTNTDKLITFLKESV